MPPQIIVHYFHNTLQISFDCNYKTQIKLAVLNNVNRIGLEFTPVTAQSIGARVGVLFFDKRVIGQRTDKRVVLCKYSTEYLIEQHCYGITYAVIEFVIPLRQINSQNILVFKLTNRYSSAFKVDCFSRFKIVVFIKLIIAVGLNLKIGILVNNLHSVNVTNGTNSGR